MQGPEENKQFDAQECLSYIVNFFQPWVNDGSNDDNHGIPDDYLFFLDWEETILRHKFNRYANKDFGEARCQITFPHPEVECSIQREIHQMVNDPHGEHFDIKYRHYDNMNIDIVIQLKQMLLDKDLWFMQENKLSFSWRHLVTIS